MSSPSHVPYQFDPGTKILSDQVDVNFQFCLDYTYDLIPTLAQSVNYLAYGLNLEFDRSNYKIELLLSQNLLYFNAINFTRNNVTTTKSSTGPITFAANVPATTDLGLWVDFGSTNLVECYQDYPLFAPKQNSVGATQYLIDKASTLASTQFDYFPSSLVWAIDNTLDAGNTYAINFETFPTVIGQEYEISAIIWAETGHVRIGITDSTFIELDTVSTVPVKVSDTYIATATSHQFYLKAAASSKGFGIGFYIGPVTNQKIPTYARYDQSYLGTDINNIYTGALVDPIDITGLTNSVGTATLAVVTDDAATLLKDIIKPGKTTNNVIRIDNSAGAVVSKVILDQPLLTLGVPYSFTIYARIVSGTGGKIRNDNAGPLADITLGNANLWNSYTDTFTPTATNQRLFIQTDIGSVVDICACYITQTALLPQAVLPYHLGTTTTEDDELSWTPSLTQNPVIAEWGNSFQTEVDIIQDVPVELGITSEGPWIGQKFKNIRSLMPGESIRTYTSPADATALKQSGTGWNYNWSGQALDYSEFNVLDFEDNFTVFSVGEAATDAPSNTIKWFAPGHTDFGYTKCKFKTPAQATTLGSDTWYCDGNSLRMRLTKAGNGDVYAACMSSVNTAGQGYRLPEEFYFETRIAFPPHVQFPWSAVWFKNPDPVESTVNPYIEFDLAEIYGSDDQFWHSSWFIHVGTNPNPNGPQTDQSRSNLYPTNLSNGAYHVLGLKVTRQWLITYLDGVEARRVPYYAEWRLHNAYILFDITGLDNVTEYNNFVSPQDMFIDYVRVYRKG